MNQYFTKKYYVSRNPFKIMASRLLRLFPFKSLALITSQFSCALVKRSSLFCKSDSKGADERHEWINDHHSAVNPPLQARLNPSATRSWTSNFAIVYSRWATISPLLPKVHPIKYSPRHCALLLVKATEIRVLLIDWLTKRKRSKEIGEFWAGNSRR